MQSFNKRMDTIIDALDVFEALLTPQRPVDLASLVQGRMTLSRSVADFLAHEWAALPQKLMGENGKSRPEVDAIHRALVSLRGDYSRHVAEWNSARIVTDWPGYLTGCNRLILSMRELVKMRASAGVSQAA